MKHMLALSLANLISGREIFAADWAASIPVGLHLTSPAPIRPYLSLEVTTSAASTKLADLRLIFRDFSLPLPIFLVLYLQELVDILLCQHFNTS